MNGIENLMNCESCKANKATIDEFLDDNEIPYRLCWSCRKRLVNYALRPLELFNLVAIHGHAYYLHDDFYDHDTGVATQPEIAVLEVDKFPFPDFDEVKDNLERLIDYAFVQYFMEARVISQLMIFDRGAILEIIKRKVDYNAAIGYRAYEVAAKVVGPAAERWIRQEWINQKDNQLLALAEAVAACLDFDEAFSLLTAEIEEKDDRTLPNNISALAHFRNAKTLDWIEKVASRIHTVPTAWGNLAAVSQFDWSRVQKWLLHGRPLSLIALDVLGECTTTKNRQNRSIRLQQNPPTLIGSPDPAVIVENSQAYLAIDSVPRTKQAVKRIANNLFETED